MSFGAAAIGQAATVALGENTNMVFADGDNASGDAVYNDGNPYTWSITGNVNVGDGVGTNAGRIFVGTNSGAKIGDLTLHGTSGAGDTLLLNGYHSADRVLGRLGHNTGGESATISITGGLAVTMGGRNLKIAQGTNTFQVLDGSLDYATNTGFGFLKNDGGGSVGHVVGASGSIIIDAVITDAAGFTAWADANGLDATGKIGTVTADSGLTLAFANDGTNTTITAIPEPSSAALLGLGGLTLILRRRM
ncbi:PEP-CTERM sorting domain-containing protein [Oceaniferula marina]|nr:PEP-CTERM sorting domain-containing protein [Oceaniferula marina]